MLLSDDPGWWGRAQARRAFCAPTSAWVAVAERGVPTGFTMPGQDEATYVAGQAASGAYLRALGLATRADLVYGMAPRAMWTDAPGRWTVAHTALPELVDASRRFVRGDYEAPPEPKLGHVNLGAAPPIYVARGKGEPMATFGDVLVAAIGYASLDPGQCFGAYVHATPGVGQSDPSTPGPAHPTPQVFDLGVTISTHQHLISWHDAFRKGAKYTVPLEHAAAGSAGPIRLLRMKFAPFAQAAARGEASVPTSAIEVSAAFVEVMGIAPHDCWGIAETAGVHTPVALVTYRPTVDDPAGWQRWAAYLATWGLTPDTIDYGHPEGVVAKKWGRVMKVE